MAGNKWILTYKAGDTAEYLLWSEDDEIEAWHMAGACCSELYDRICLEHDIVGFEAKYYFLVELYTKERYLKYVRDSRYVAGTLG